MKPHLAYLNNTLIKKELANRALDVDSDYARYRAIVNKALAKGISKFAITQELEREIIVISESELVGDPIFQYGVRNAKTSCINAMKLIIEELRGEN